MIETVCIGSGRVEECPAEALDKLRAARAVFHPIPAHHSFEWLKAAGVGVEPFAGQQDGILVIPCREPGANESTHRAEQLERLAQIVDRLLGPGGCPWDQAQTFESLKPHLIEEAHELFEAIDLGDREAMLEELGDVLLQPYMYAQIANSQGDFDIGDVARVISDKLVRRHPHVFGDTKAETEEQVLANWNRIKASEKGESLESVLDSVPKSLPALMRASEISRKAARAGFEWPDYDGVLLKLQEELDELSEAVHSGARDRIESEIGDLLFTVVNIARWQKVDPEEALRKMLRRFESRFRAMEVAATKPLGELNPEEWDQLWNQAKDSRSEERS